jgi:hypothetical protein
MKKQDLKRLLDKHRKDAFITCDESCFCWDVELLLHNNDKGE